MTRHSGQLQESSTAPPPGDRLRLPLNFDTALLDRDLAQFDTAAWTAHYVPEHHVGEWSILPLRAPVGAFHPILRIATSPGCDAWEDTELLAVSPYFQAVLASFSCPIQAARLMRLQPGSSIRPHRDYDLAAEFGVARVHIPIRTNDGVDFRLNGVRVDMPPGSTWYLRLSDTHSVTNDGPTERVHLVIDLVVDAWLKHMLDSAAGVSPHSTQARHPGAYQLLHADSQMPAVLPIEPA